MKKVLLLGALIALAFSFAGVANADTCSTTTNCLAAGGVTYTFTSSTDASDPAGTFDVTMVVSGASTTGTATFSSFAVEFSSGGTNATNVTLESTPSGTGTWSFIGNAPNNPGGCGTSGSAAHWCFSGGSFSVPSASTFTFVFDVSLPGSPDTADLMIGQGMGAFAISASTGVGTTPPPPTPEPASIVLLGLGLAGAPFLRRKK